MPKTDPIAKELINKRNRREPVFFYSETIYWIACWLTCNTRLACLTMSMSSIKIAWHGKHFGEEPVLVGSEKQGSGTIFFGGCNLACVFCQNYQISQQGVGDYYSIEDLVEIMLDLQKQGAANINLVTPTIWFKQIRKAVIGAKKQGLILPIVWNSNGYEKVEIIEEMNGLVDVYLPDFKYGDDLVGLKFSKAPNYSQVAFAAVDEMFNQVGNLVLAEQGLAKKGLMIRHLVLPNNPENSFKVLELLKKIDPKVNISLMNQYAPIFNAQDFSEINREVSDEEFHKVYDYFFKIGLQNGWVQTEKSAGNLVPDFQKDKPFEV
jgi:putative pyruvate formate lyase activating enzyme